MDVGAAQQERKNKGKILCTREGIWQEHYTSFSTFFEEAALFPWTHDIHTALPSDVSFKYQRTTGNLGESFPAP